MCIKLGYGSVDRMLKSLSSEEYLDFVMFFQRKAQREELARLQAGG